MRVVSQYVANKNNAGPKAKIDIENILKDEYNAKIYTNKVNDKGTNILTKIKKYFFINKSLKTNDLVVIQIPFSNKMGVLNMAKNKIGLIHDLDGIRFQDKKILHEEILCLNSFKHLIVHNETMKKYLIDNGVKTPMTSLELFDYLVEDSANNRLVKEFDSKNTKIVYPGNLEKRKSDFLYGLEEEKMKYKLYVYGTGLEEVNNKNIIYKGSFPPDVIPNKLEGDLGLVWSGKIDERDENTNEKGYNKINMPHKLSCYIAAGLPVIIWDKAAACSIVEKYNIGYKISNLYDINKLNFDDYEEKKKNVKELSKKVRMGYFTKRALNKALGEIQYGE